MSDFIDFEVVSSDDEEDSGASFSHCGPDGAWTPYPRSQCATIDRAMAKRPAGGAVQLSRHLPFEIRWGAEAVSARMPQPPRSRMIQVNARSQNTRVVRRDPTPRDELAELMGRRELSPRSVGRVKRLMSQQSGGASADAPRTPGRDDDDDYRLRRKAELRRLVEKKQLNAAEKLRVQHLSAYLGGKLSFCPGDERARREGWPALRGSAARRTRGPLGWSREATRWFVLGRADGEPGGAELDWTLRWFDDEAAFARGDAPRGAASLRHGDAELRGEGADIEVRVSGGDGFALGFDDGADRTRWWRALATTIARTRQLVDDGGAPLRAGAAKRDGDDAPSALEAAGAAVYGSLFGVEPRAPRRRERALSVDGGDRGRAGEAKEAYQQVVKLIIRPPRASYGPADLGPSKFMFPRRFLEPGVVGVERVDFSVTNKFDYALQVSHWRPEHRPPKQTPCILYLHGNASCRVEALQVLKLALELGASLCAVDCGGSGLSDGEFVSLGYYERHDALAVLDELRAAELCDGNVALWGRSMGAVAAILAASTLDPLVSCVVADSPFSSLPDLCHDLLDKHVKTGLLVDAAIEVVSASVAYRAGFNVRDVDAEDAIPACVCPVCLVHGDEDTFVRVDHSRRLLAAATAAPETKFVPHAGGKHDSRRPDAVLSAAAAFLLRHLRREAGGAKAERELASCLAVYETPISAPPWAGASAFTSGATAKRQSQVKGALGRAFRF